MILPNDFLKTSYAVFYLDLKEKPQRKKIQIACDFHGGKLEKCAEGKGENKRFTNPEKLLVPRFQSPTDSITVILPRTLKSTTPTANSKI